MKKLVISIIFIILDQILHAQIIANSKNVDNTKSIVSENLVKKLTNCKDSGSYFAFSEKGDSLLEKNIDKYVYPASLVKIMTLYLTFEAIKKGKITFDQEIVCDERCYDILKVNKYNRLNIKIGDKVTVKEAILAVIVKSYNECAYLLAKAVSGSEWKFVREMNYKARELGMNDSAYRNSSGLHDEGQYTTVYDLSKLARSIKKDFDEYYYLFSSKEFTYKSVKHKSHNNFLLEYKGAEGMKTGFTSIAGFNLVSAAKRDGNRVFLSLVSCPTSKSRFDLTKELLDISFDNYKLLIDQESIETLK